MEPPAFIGTVQDVITAVDAGFVSASSELIPSPQTDSPRGNGITKVKSVKFMNYNMSIV